MTIYCTPHANGKYTGPSEPVAGFETFEDVLQLMGEPEKKYKAFLKYENVIFTRYICKIDRPATGSVVSPVNVESTDG